LATDNAEMRVEHEEIDVATGSFDAVRQTPHFAQDDRVLDFAKE
jgi:hypothetical protein